MVGVSVLLAWMLNRALGATGLSVPWWVDAPSVAGFYGLVYAGFDKRAWRLSLMRALGIVRIPNLSGTWSGTARPSGGKHAYEHPATIEITQTWRDICVRLRTENSASRSSIAAVTLGGPEHALLTYEYANEPAADAVDGMHAHRGTTRLVLSPDGRVLEGDYYTGRDRESHGVLRLQKDGVSGGAVGKGDGGIPGREAAAQVAGGGGHLLGAPDARGGGADEEQPGGLDVR
jgi:hypothetical protein